jgi:hypothetical protein
MNWLYENSKDNTSRFVLGKEGKKPLVCFGINPSTAVPQCLDNTLKSVERISIANGFDGWIMLNIYPQRATDPNCLNKFINEDLHKLNRAYIQKVLKEYKPTLWAAWGTLIEKRIYLAKCLFDIVEISNEYNCSWITFGKVSKDGHPHHPLYLSKQAPKTDFLINDYLIKIGSK